MSVNAIMAVMASTGTVAVASTVMLVAIFKKFAR